MTCHYITESFELKEIILAIKYLQYPHTANRIQETLEEIINQWNLREKIFFCTTDNAANMKKMLNQISWIKRLSCTAHTIQLVVGKGLLLAETLIARAKRVINFFSTPKQNERLIAAQKDNLNDLDSDMAKESRKYFLHAITDVDTRWSSTYFAWERLILLKPFIDNVLSTMALSKDPETKKDLKRLKEINLTDNEYECIRDLIEVLGPFAEVTEYLEGSHYSTMGFMGPAIEKLKKEFAPLASNNAHSNVDLESPDNAFDEHNFEDAVEESEPGATRKIKISNPVNTYGLVNSVRSDLYNALQFYFPIISEEGFLAAILDPRWKNLSFSTNEQHELAQKNFRDVYEIAKTSSSATIKDPSNNLLGIKKKKSCLYQRSILESEDIINSNDDEVDRYLAISQQAKSINALEWWNIYKKEFPILSELARKFLAIQATSAASEWLFSDAGNIMTAKRTSMKYDLFETLIFLKRNRWNV